MEWRLANKPLVFVPIYDIKTGNKNHEQFHIVGFGAFMLTAVDGTGHGNATGTFQRFVAATEMGGTYDSGARAVGLKR
jgi:hypothetical protein